MYLYSKERKKTYSLTSLIHYKLFKSYIFGRTKWKVSLLINVNTFLILTMIRIISNVVWNLRSLERLQTIIINTDVATV